nr:RDD family protein [Paenibacillus phyllosphaerae]
MAWYSLCPLLFWARSSRYQAGDRDYVQSAFNSLSTIYQVVLPIYWGGQTIGKRAIKARIVRVDGGPVGWWTMIRRVYISGLVYAFTLGIALIVSAIMIGTREGKRGIHDFIAGTQVVED